MKEISNKAAKNNRIRLSTFGREPFWRLIKEENWWIFRHIKSTRDEKLRKFLSSFVKVSIILSTINPQSISIRNEKKSESFHLLFDGEVCETRQTHFRAIKTFHWFFIASTRGRRRRWRLFQCHSPFFFVVEKHKQTENRECLWLYLWVFNNV